MSAARHLGRLRRTLGFLSSAEARRTLTTLVVAVGSSVFLTLNGCATTGGIEPRAALLQSQALGQAGAASPATPAPPTAIESV